ncbi:bcl-2-like protein 2 [Latimeria chalumnae]|uniref:BCL2 like 2 n=1 Tax=Latimeria chalumnae TaxID=7897 RepID=H3AAS7_LATCH|nr:PREDICTED: bcl-2-like protein 2 [Latimeria chalumnae]XP_014351331.1 PREDICTED: bcl-2-like protein 2 [Latimeria chalumnae]XP_014351332.1 PREDICTED: bcl-2-like protein 2 [Latimeria chalumnae]|eukprot:XP_006008143.1 PREDICTED: bcl-2-like protein 2 [Latimeria chalumnae]
MDSLYSNRGVVEDFIYYKLGQKGYSQQGAPTDPPANPLYRAMREAGDEFEARFHRTFNSLSSHLHITPGTAYRRFAETADSLFQDGVNWGRVVALFVFSAALCVESVDKEMASLVGRIIDWTVTYVESSLQDWINHSGGWSAFVCLYGNGAVGGARRFQEGYWSSMKTVVTGAVALGAVMTVGALFASR